MSEKLFNQKVKKFNISPNVKGLWPIFFSYFIIALTFAAYVMNMINISKIIWPNDQFHALEMGIILTMRYWVMAISGMIIGHYADFISRKKLFLFVISLIGFIYIINGFAPEGQENISWTWFLICNITSGFGLGGIRPIILSYTNDCLERNNRSLFFGVFHSIAQISLVIGMIISSVLIYTGYWRIYFWSIGILVILSVLIIGIKIKEPKRGSQSLDALTEVLGNENVKYNYQITKDTIKSTILKPTNIVALIEGIFTCILLGTLHFLILTYLQTPPSNISSITTSLIMIFFGMPGAFIGSIGFAKKSDKWGKRKIQIRLDLIVFSLIWIAIAQFIIFLVPFTNSGFTEAEGNNFLFLLQFPQFWITCLIWTSICAVRGIYQINQPPVLQSINLPEAQGKVSSWNQFLETLGEGTGPLIAGAVLNISEQNYILTSLVIAFIGIPGAILWFYAKLKIDKDISNINYILTERVEELRDLNNTKNEINNTIKDKS
jgi:MFS family permease